MSGPRRSMPRAASDCARRSSTCCVPRAIRRGLPADERDIVVYTRQLMRTNRVEQAVFDALLQRHGAQWLVEMTAMANFYVALCGVVNAFEVSAPPDGDRFDG